MTSSRLITISRFPLFLLLLLTSLYSTAQEKTNKFQGEVAQIIAKTPAPAEKHQAYLFTGSSSIRLWDDLKAHYPNQTVINTGFGGSQTHELLQYTQELILNYSPKKIFIYEGDNDIAAGKSPLTILKTMQKLVGKIHGSLPEAEIIIISAKPSLSRWHLKEEYMNLNRLYKAYCHKEERVQFANVWDIMLNEKGQPKPDIFIEDGLHMNPKGYELWAEVLSSFIP